MFKKKFYPPVLDMNEMHDVKSKIKKLTKNARNHKYQYIDQDAVRSIVGKWTPISVINFSYLLECFLSAMNDSGISIMDAKGAYKTDIPNVPESLIGIGKKIIKKQPKLYTRVVEFILGFRFRYSPRMYKR